MATMSFNTPAAVTSAPAPGPVTTSGFVLYRFERMTTWLSVPRRLPRGELASTASMPTRMVRPMLAT